MHRAIHVLVVALMLSLLGAGGATAQQSGQQSVQQRAEDAELEVERRSGPGRIETAVDVALQHWDTGAATVLLATAGNYPDALAAAPLAAALDAPLLLTPGNALPDSVGEALDRLAPQRVIVLGGAGAVSDAVVAAVEQRSSSPTVERISGTNRFETAAAIARRTGAPRGVAVLASGFGFADALSAGATAATPARPPVLLTARDSLPAATMAAIQDLGVTRVVVIGGVAAVDSMVIQELHAQDIMVDRLFGRDRFRTAAAVLRALPTFGEVPEHHRIVVATGTDFPDALTAGPLAARLGSALTLAARDQMPVPVQDELHVREPVHAVLVGGAAALGEKAERDVREAMGRPQPVTAAAGPTLTVDGDEVVVDDATWRDGDEPERPTFTLLGVAAGEMVDIMLTDVDVTDTDTGDKVRVTLSAQGRSGLPQEVEVRHRPPVFHPDAEEDIRSVAWGNVRLIGCPCQVEVVAGSVFSPKPISPNAQGSFRIKAVRSVAPRPVLVDLPFRTEVDFAVPGQTGVFDAQLHARQVMTFGYADGAGLQGHLGDDPDSDAAVNMRTLNTSHYHWMSTGWGPRSPRYDVRTEEATLRLISSTDRYRFELVAADWVTGRATVFASLPVPVALPEGTQAVTAEVDEPGQAIEVPVTLEAGEEVELAVSWSLTEPGATCRVLAPDDDLDTRRCRWTRVSENAYTVTLSAEVSGVHRLFVHSHNAATGRYTVARR